MIYANVPQTFICGKFSKAAYAIINIDFEIIDSVVGFTTFHTMKLWGNIGGREIVVLIDRGATHNLLSRRLVEQLGIAITGSSKFDVTPSDG